MKLIILEDGTTVAEIDDYPFQIPRAGEYIYHPPVHGGLVNVMSVKSVTYGILARDPSEEYFVGSPQPFVEVWV